MEIESGDIVICTVEKIVGTMVFVKVHLAGKELEGSIVINEIAPGRIRNLRSYVVPKKRIVCKVLRISPRGNIELSLRRVTQKEKKEALEREKKEKSYISILKSVLGKEVEETIKKIEKEKEIFDFFEEVKENPKILEKLINKEDAKKVLDILKTQKPKKISIKREIYLTSTKPNGLELIKNILGSIKDVEIKYISAGKYSIKAESDNPKDADKKIKETTSKIEKASKQKGLSLNVKEK